MESRGSPGSKRLRAGVIVMGERCPWYVAGPLLGLLMIGLRLVLNKSFGALGGYIDIAENSANPRKLGFRAYLLAGMVIGGSLYASTLGSFDASHFEPSIPFSRSW